MRLSRFVWMYPVRLRAHCTSSIDELPKYVIHIILYDQQLYNLISRRLPSFLPEKVAQSRCGVAISDSCRHRRRLASSSNAVKVPRCAHKLPGKPRSVRAKLLMRTLGSN
jgi:hypothetical protein